MTRTVVVIGQREDDSLWASVECSAIRVADKSLPLAWSEPADPLTTAGALSAYGAQVRDSLCGHSEIRKVLDALFVAPPDQKSDLHLSISGVIGEGRHWETLQDYLNAHVALRGSPRLCRLASNTATPPLIPQMFPDTIRISAFLSALGVSAQQECLTLDDAVKKAVADGLKVELTLYVAEDILLPPMSSFAANVLPLPADTLSLQQELTRTRPHLIHFFCHGVSEPVQALQFASFLDHTLDAREGSILLSIERLVKCGVLQTAWAVVFNCCDGGRPTAALNSMGFTAVAEGGVPAAIGMGAPLPAAAASVFSQAFYSALLYALGRIASTPSTTPISFDFGRAIGPARQALEANPADPTSWWLPIIYLHRTPFWLQTGAGQISDAAAVKLATLTGLLKTLPADTPPAYRASLMALFDQPPVVPKSLRPDGFGVFAGGA